MSLFQNLYFPMTVYLVVIGIYNDISSADKQKVGVYFPKETVSSAENVTTNN